MPDDTDPFEFRDNGYTTPLANSWDSALTDTSISALTSSLEDTDLNSFSNSSSYLSALNSLQQNTNSYLSALTPLQQNSNSYLSTQNTLPQNNSLIDLLKQMFPLKTVDETTDLSSTQTPTDLMTSTLTTPLHQGVQNGLNAVFGSTPAYAGTQPTSAEIVMPTDEELRTDFDAIWPKIRKNEKYVSHPYLDSNCLDTSGTGHLMDLNNLENDPLIDFSDPQKVEDYLVLSQKMKDEICTLNEEGKLTTNWTSDGQEKYYEELNLYPVDEQTDTEYGLQFIKERLPQLLRALSIQNPPLKWQQIGPGGKYVLMDLLYNPGVDTPIYNYKTNTTGWPKFFDAFAKGDFERAKKEVTRKGISPIRNKDLQDSLEKERLFRLRKKNTSLDGRK